jgi:excisionase family DNA binding protein
MSMIEQVTRGMLTVHEAAEELGLKESTVRAWLLRTRLSHIRLSARGVRIPAAEVSRLIRENTVPAREREGF